MDLDNRTHAEGRSYARLCRDGAYRVAYRQSLVERYRAENARLWDGALPPATGRTGVYYRDPPRLVIVRRVSAGTIALEGGRERRWFEVGSRGGRLRSPEGPALGRFTAPLPDLPAPYVPASLHVLAPLDPKTERIVLLHEMIHAALYFSTRQAEASHGPAFLAELARLARLGETWAEAEIDRYRRPESRTAPSMEER